MRLSALCTVALALLCASLATAQTWQRQQWTTEQGLPQNSVHALLQTPDGYLWLATENGAARFNGLRFAHAYTGNAPAFGSNDLCCLAQAIGNTVLFGTANGVVLEAADDFARINGVEGVVTAMQRAGDGTVLVLTADALRAVHGRSSAAVALPEGDEALTLGEGQGGSVLIAGRRALYRWLGGTPQKLGVLPGVVVDVFEDGAHQLWTRSSAEVDRLDAQLRVVRRWHVGPDLPGSRLEMMRPWPGGALVGVNRGAAVLEADGAVHPIPELADNAVLSATLDREGDAWFGTDSGGVIVLRQRWIGSIAALQGEPLTALAAGSQGTVWVGTRDAGLRAVRDGKLLPLAGASELSSGVVLSVASDGSGGVWAGSPEGLYHWKEGRLQHLTAADGLPDDFVRTLLATPGGSVWAGTRQGIAELRNDHVLRTLTAADGLPSDAIGPMLQDRAGTLWIGTQAGLARLAHDRVSLVETLDRSRVAVASLLESQDGTLWVGTAEGPFLIRDGKLVALEMAALHAPIAAMLEDRSGNLWMSTPGGLARVSAAALRACTSAAACAATVRFYGTADGMPSVELAAVGTPSAAVAPDGSLWFATRRGAARVDAHAASAPPVAPGVAIARVLRDGRAVRFHPGIRISPGQQRVAISFDGLSLRAPAEVEFRSLLQGFDREWSAWTRSDTAEYTNLPPGRYMLHVQARDADGLVSQGDATVALLVEAPLYRRWWFYLLLLLLAALAAYGLYWLRVQRVSRRYEAVLGERNRIAREIHDTLAQDFVAVSLQLEVTAQLLQMGATDAAQQQVDTTRTLVREGLADARESIWALRAEGGTQTLPARLAAAVASQPAVTLHVSGAYRALSAAREREIFRIAKEAIGNADRHASAQQIVVDLLYLEDAVMLRVRDDGVGFDPVVANELTGHYGVRGMRERAAAMHATLTVQSASGEGTCIELRVPVAGEREA